MKKIKSFTILELVVAMMLGSIVIGLAYFSFSSISGRYTRLTGNFHKISDLRAFKRMISEDVRKAVAIERVSEGLLFSFSDLSTATYMFNEENIVRRQRKNDLSFNLSAVPGETNTIDEESSVIEKFTISVGAFDKPDREIFFKSYTPVELLALKSAANENSVD